LVLRETTNTVSASKPTTSSAATDFRDIWSNRTSLSGPNTR
jgi:hypothetical protein